MFSLIYLAMSHDTHLQDSIEFDPTKTLHLLFWEPVLYLFLLVSDWCLRILLHGSFSQGPPLLLALKQSLLILEIFQNLGTSVLNTQSRSFASRCKPLTLSPLSFVCCIASPEHLFNRHLFTSLDALNDFSKYANLGLGFP